MDKNINVYSNGLCYCSVCAHKKYSIEEITKEVNIINFTGIKSKWKHSKLNFITGEKNPHQCERHKNKKHYLFVC